MPSGSGSAPRELEEQLNRLHAQLATRRHGGQIISIIRRIAERTYGVRFPTSTSMAERVLWPAMGAESRGMEDARFVRFVDDDGTVTYFATYTAYDGTDISQQLLETSDFLSLHVLAHRRSRGSRTRAWRCSRGGSAVGSWPFRGPIARRTPSPSPTTPDSGPAPLACQVPTRAWEVLQIGNCGSPIETDAGWLVLTHGVGPMRTYSIGAILLDLDDPTRILGQLREPLLTPAPDEQDGYVPNVVYSCGALVHAGVLVIPYGIGDAAIGVATVPLLELLDALRPPDG